jgi:hypothetical protein
MIVVGCPNPKGFLKTNIYFSKIKYADEYIESLSKEFLLKKAQSLEMNNSKRKNKLIRFSKPKKYLLTHKGNKYLLWESMK